MRRVILVHGDSDGVASGALALHYFRDIKKEDTRVVFTHPAGLLKDLKEFSEDDSSLFIADIAFPEDTYKDIISRLNMVSRRAEVLYIDHHPLPLEFSKNDVLFEFVHTSDASSSELTYRYFESEISIDYSRIFLFGAIGDYLDETQYVKKWIEYWDKRAIYFESGVLTQGLEASRKLYDFKRHVVRHLSENRLPSSLSELLVKALIESQNEEEMRIAVKDKLVKMKSLAYVIEPKGSLGRAANYARIYSNMPVGVAIEYINDKANMSFRSCREIDVNALLRKIVRKHNWTGGGHPHAAGARIPKKNLFEFLEYLDEEITMVIGKR